MARERGLEALSPSPAKYETANTMTITVCK